MEKLLARACSDDLLSVPHFPALPSGWPFHMAVVALALPAGCAPPEGLAARVASGAGATRAEAAFRAMMEGAERYALQYSAARPARLEPLATAGGLAEDESVTRLTLGAPEGGGVTSRGAAAGERLRDAGDRACLETLEHLALDRLAEGDGGAFHKVELSELMPYCGYLDGQLRRLSLWMAAGPQHIVAIARTADRNGGRPTIGSAAGQEPRQTALRAVEEAMFLWRNMVEMERRGAPVPAGPGGDAARLYRGAVPAPGWLDALIASGGEGRAPPRPLTDPAPLLETVARVAGRRARLFDMTVSALPVPVARVVLG
ncbi:hypothetical protein [Haematobacter genomosp. 1]|nr:hypothetical protein [Haematobacter genomosp. 1]